MAIIKVQSNSNRQTTGTNASVTLSACTKGNLILMLVGISSLQTDTPTTAGTTAWTEDYPGGGASKRLHIYSKIADGGETTLAHTVGATSSKSTHGYEFAWVGYRDPESRFGTGDATFSATTSATTPSINNTDQDWVAVALFCAGGSIVAGSPTWNNGFGDGEATTECVSSYLVGSAPNASLNVTWGTWTTNRTGNQWLGTWRWPRRRGELLSMGVGT